MRGMVPGKRTRGKPRQRWEIDIIDTFGTTTVAQWRSQGGRGPCPPQTFGKCFFLQLSPGVPEMSKNVPEFRLFD